MTPNITNWRPPWETKEWRFEALTWIDAQLIALGIERTAEPDQFHIRVWSTVMRIHTNKGLVYFKAGGPSQAHEAALLLGLNKWRPKDTIQVLAADPDKAWMLLEDGGQTLRPILNEGGDIKAHWMNILPQYADYQIETSNHIDEILTFSCPDYRLEKLPGLVERVLEDTQTLMLNQEDGLTQAERQQLLNDLPKIKNMVDQLNSLGIPAALDHNDMGDNNVFVGDDRIVFFDWGDANITHPFMSMVVTQRVIAFTLELDSQNDSLAWVRDAYLEPWTSCANRTELEESYAAIQRLGRLHRALIWYNVFKMLAPDLASEFRDAPAAWLQLYLNFPSDE